MLNNLTFFQNIADIFWLKFTICIISGYFFSTIGILSFLNCIKNKSICNQPIRSDGPQTHINSKKNTPTFGGFFIILATIFTTILFLDLSNSYIWIFILVISAFATIGFIDDLMKVIYKNTNGFKGSVKFIIQIITILSAYIWLGQINEIHHNSQIFLPFQDGISFFIPATFYLIFFIITISASANAVNLTDGLDGLVSVPAIINLICLSALIFIAANLGLANDFNAPYIKNSFELSFFCASLIGAIIGFLQFNLKPAKIFMGDTGSLAIGAVIGLVAVIIKQEFIFLIISLLFVIEALSVILQVGSYKLRKKRIFLMAPIHHHFEKKGFSEKQVVRGFWGFSLVCGVLGIGVVLF